MELVIASLSAYHTGIKKGGAERGSYCQRQPSALLEYAGIANR